MPLHRQITTCRKGAPVSKVCSCEHCCLAVCAVCGGAEGTLTTDCPGERVRAELAQEVFETALDYTDARGWHLSEERRSPRFQRTAAESTTTIVDPRTLIAPTIDWARVDLYTKLQGTLAEKAFAWAVADRACEDASAKLVCVEGEAEPLRGQTELDGAGREALVRLERAKLDFRRTSAEAERRDDEFRQAARRLVQAMERAP